MGSRSPNLPEADGNAEKKTLLLRRLHQLLAIAADPAFDGTISVELSVKNGRFGRPKYTVVEYDRDAKPAN